MTPATHLWSYPVGRRGKEGPEMWFSIRQYTHSRVVIGLLSWARVLGCFLTLLAIPVFFCWPLLNPWINAHVSEAAWNQRKAAFEAVAIRAQPLVEAIERFHKDIGKIPESLGQLVPEYLPSIPDTGMSEYPSFEYRTYDVREARITLLSYDLGRWAEGATLNATIDGEGRVSTLQGSRLPATKEPEAFDRRRWQDDRDARVGMVPSWLSPRDRLLGVSEDELLDQLGPPDKRVMLRDTPWELRVSCPRGPYNCDRFIYWPTGAYTKSGMRIGDWCYGIEFF